MIPPEYPRWGGFIQLHDESLKNQIKLLQEVADSKLPTAEERKLGLAWNASMKRFADWEEGKGEYIAIATELKNLDQTMPDSDMDATSWADCVSRYIAHGCRVGVHCPFSLETEANLQDVNKVVTVLSPGSGSLPSRDYYLDEKFAQKKAWFGEHLTAVALLLQQHGITLEDDFSARVLRFETKLAMICMKRDQARSFDKYYSITTLDGASAELNELKHLPAKEANYAAHSVDMQDLDYKLLTEPIAVCNADDIEQARRFLETLATELKLRDIMATNFARHYPETAADPHLVTRVMVFDGDFFRRIFRLLGNASQGARKDLRAYFQYQIVRFGQSYCSKALDECFFDFFTRKLQGQAMQKPADKRTVATVNSWLGELLGKIYVGRFFSETDKSTVRNMVAQVLAVMQNSLRTNDWLTEGTKEKALVKLSRFVVKIGYPDKWKNYDALDFADNDSLFTMAQKVAAFKFQDEFLDKVNSVKDKSKWEMTPQTVNAYFHPLNNEIVFPAAILQPPFYSKSLADLDFPLGTLLGLLGL